MLRHFIDLPALRDLSASFSRLTGIPMAVLDITGEILIATNWQSICTAFHRKHPATAARCLESDTVLAGRLAEGRSYSVYRCENGLVDVAVPIIIGNVHVGNLFCGQFFTAPPDVDRFARQADEFGFDKAAYLRALSAVPVLSSEQIQQAVGFLTDLTAVVGNAGLDRQKLSDINRQLEERIRERTRDLERRIEFERLIAGISSELAAVGGAGIDAAIGRVLEAVGRFTGADRATVFTFAADQVAMSRTHEWCAEGIEPLGHRLAHVLKDTELPWVFGQMGSPRILHVPDVAALPAEAVKERALLESFDVQSLLVVPMESAGRVNGLLGFDSVRARRVWSDDDQRLLKFLGETIGHVVERQRAERALRDSEARWQFALESAGDGLWDWAIQDDRLHYSDRGASMLGYAPHEIGHTWEAWESLMHPDDLEAVREDVRRHLSGETAIYQNEHRVRCKDGSWKWVLSRAKVIEWTADGRPSRLIGTHTDVSSHKQAQADRERVIAELKAALAEVKTLTGLLPICAHCKKIRDDQGYWEQIETYILNHSDARFSHGICVDCMRTLYPEFCGEDAETGKGGPEGPHHRQEPAAPKPARKTKAGEGGTPAPQGSEQA